MSSSSEPELLPELPRPVDAAGATATELASTGAPGTAWRPALVPEARGRTWTDWVELAIFAGILLLALATPARTADGRPNAPGMQWLDAATGGGICTWKRWTGNDCAGCGLTRAFVQLAHLHPVEAVKLNPVAPAIFLWIGWHLLVVLARMVLSKRLVHGIPPGWVWRAYVATFLGFAALGTYRLIHGLLRT